MTMRRSGVAIRRGKWVLAVLVLAGAACGEVRTSYSVYNNTGAPFVVQACGTRQIVPPAQALVVEPDGFCAQWTILRTQRVWRYVALPSELGDEYLQPRGRGHRRLSLQVQPGGEILAVKVDARAPVPPDQPQPVGFPLRPASVEL